jgi:hypothetical protein
MSLKCRRPLARQYTLAMLCVVSHAKGQEVALQVLLRLPHKNSIALLTRRKHVFAVFLKGVHSPLIRSMQPVRSVLNLAIVICLLILSLWPAIYNGGPFFFSDTPAYVRYADAAIARITRHQAEWSQSRLMQASAAGQQLVEGDVAADRKAPFAGRSIYYGALLRLGDAYGMMWPSIVLQAAALLLAIALTLRHASGISLSAVSVAVVALALTTPMAFFASRLMPDVFAGVTILAIANLIVYGGRMSRAHLVAWMGLLSVGLLFHNTHVLIALSLLGLCLLGRVLFRASVSWLGLGCVLLGVLIAFAGDAAFTLATKRAFGVAPIRPPFLTARLIADGPGTAYVKASCPASGFAVCSFVDRLPVATADLFLWSPDAAKGGVFTPADPDVRRALSDEQFRFAIAVLRFDPLGEAIAMARNALLQAGMVSVSDFDLNQQDKAEFRQELPPRYLEAVEKTRSWRGTIPVATMSAAILVVLLVSSAYIVSVFVFRGSVGGNGSGRLAVIIVLGVLVNAFVCGALSEPYDRYQARVVWLIPFVAGLIYQARLHRAASTTIPSFVPGQST